MMTHQATRHALCQAFSSSAIPFIGGFYKLGLNLLINRTHLLYIYALLPIF